MRCLIVPLSVLLLVACATSRSDIFDARYSNSEIASMTAIHFDVLQKDAQSALKPAFKKYGKPDAYIDGMMSSVDVPDLDYLYGSGHFKTKLSLDEHTFWRVEGENLSGHFAPVKTAHLVYETMRLDPLSNTFEFSETLSKRGQTFTVFERKVGTEIIITVHKSDDLSQTHLEDVRFFSD